MKKFYLWSLLLGLVLGTFTFAACGNDDEEASPKGGETGGITTNELLGTWYLIPENHEDYLSMGIITFMDGGNGVSTEISAEKDHNWELEGDEVSPFTYTFDGKNLKIITTYSDGETETDQAEIYKKDGKYMIRQYEDGKAYDHEIVKVGSTNDAVNVFKKLIEEKKKGSESDNALIAKLMANYWYIVDENSSDEVRLDFINFVNESSCYFVVFDAERESNWQITNATINFKYTLSGNHITLTPVEGDDVLEADIIEENGKLILARYEDGQVMDRVELIQTTDPQAVQRVLYNMIQNK